MTDPHQSKIESLQRQILKLKAELVTDELTKILNRRGLMEALEIMRREVNFSLQTPQKRKSLIITSLSVIFIDIDHFKQVNTDYGHDGGDAALVVVARTIKKRLRGIDIVGRYGGEEIVAGLIGADRAAAGRIADDVREVIERTSIGHRAGEFTVTISCGVAGLKPGESLDDLLKRADEALYEAKNTGRNKVVIAK